MAHKMPDLRPIQVFLDTKRFIELPEPQPFRGGSKDFFQGNNRAFAEHKTRLKTRVENVADSLKRTKQPGGFIKVRQREEALAKSHRPLNNLFSQSNRFVLVGAEKVGELLFQATPWALDRLANIIETRAELTPRLVDNTKTGKPELRVSGYRSELGGIDDIRLYDATDKVTFSADEAVRWMRQPNVIGGYIVELFRPDRTASPDAVDQMVAQFRQGLEHLKGGLLVRPFLPSTVTTQFGEPSLVLLIQPTTDSRRLIELPFLADGRTAVMAEASLPIPMRGVRGDLDYKPPCRASDVLRRASACPIGRAATGPRNYPRSRRRPPWAGGCARATGRRRLSNGGNYRRRRE